MNTRNLMRKLPSCLLGAIFAAGIASTTMVSAIDGDPPGLFELDGNIPDDIPGVPAGNPGTAGDDWGGLVDSAIKANLVTFTGINADPAPASIFTQGGSKDVNDISAWKHTSGSVPDKDDITNAYAAAYTNPDDVCVDATDLDLNGELDDVVPCTTAGSTIKHFKDDLIVYFGLDRFANNGDANAGFWFFQDDVSPNADGTFNGVHVAKTATTPGDVFVVVKYPQDSNTDPIIKVYEWDPNDADGDGNADPSEKGGKFSPLDLLISSEHAQCDGSGGRLACAITNLEQQASPPWDYTPKSGSGLPFESFFEGGINVSRLLGSTPCFASFLAETRSSESQTAQLKDFVLDAFPVCGAEVSKLCGSVDINTAGTEATVNFHGTASNTGGQSVFIELLDTPAGSTFTAVCFDDDNNPNGACGDGGDVAVPATLNATASFTLGAGKTVVYEGHYTESNITGLSFSDTVTLNFYADSSKAALLGTDSASVTCSGDVEPKLKIVKACDTSIGTDGVRLVVDGTKVVVEVGNIITVTNTGTEPLIGVTVSDTQVPTLVKTSGPAFTCVAGSGQCTGGSLAVGDVAVFTQTYKPATVTGGSDPGSVSFSNTATATGTGALSTNAALTDLGSVGTAECELCPDDIVE